MASDSNALVKSQFGVAAADYASSDVHAKGESLDRIVELAAPQANWRALDVATGAGHMAAAFAPFVREIIASDITPEMLRETATLAASRNLTNMTTATAEASALPFPDTSFDLVCCRLAAHHFPDLKAFVAEVQRVLKIGGRFALVDNVAPSVETLPDANETDLAEATAAYNAFEKLRDPSHGNAPPPSVWLRLLADAHINVIAREQFGKDLDFDSWVTRMRCSEKTIEKLRHILTEGAPRLREFLRPRHEESGALYFTLQELLLVGTKNA
ncbi:methyltransferase type 11 [Hyphomicrobium methylovorum]|uniref:class I SAM-dependent methyltransferase n=1 Tax=Hyphomicrobium methylovorum TaxID=84 RepID=UPI0015E6A800|nr:class I SAM-dependent methyltransferase [Hyphomicrobium methylovorum]MBA2126220.1 methyltransferase type 11 [Hyphomicrobium methylovorum]